MTDPSATFALNLKDDTSGAAERAAGALEDLQSKIDVDTKALREMQKAMRRLKGDTSVSGRVFNDLKDKIAAQKATVAQAQARYVELGGTFTKTVRETAEVASVATEATDRFGGLTKQVGSLGGRLGGVSGKVGGLGSRLAALGGPIGLAGASVALLAAGFVALTAAVGAATIALARYGVAQSNARRAELLHLEGLSLLPRMYGMARASGEQMQTAIDRVSDSTSLGRTELARYGDQLSRMGLRGRALEEGLGAVGIAATAAGDRGAAFARRWITAAAMTGRSVEDAAAQIEARFGPLARRVMLDWDVQLQKLRQNFTRLFDGLRIEGFLTALQGITSQLSQSTVTGRALKQVMESMLQPLIDVVASSGPFVTGFIQGLVIETQRLTIMVLRLRLWLLRTFGLDTDILGGMDALQAGTTTARIAFATMIGVVATLTLTTAALAVALGVVAVSAIILASPFILLAAVLAGAIYAGFQLVRWWQAQDWAGLATSLIDGLVNGLQGGVRRVTDAVRGLATSARGAFENALGIQSPSRVFAELGEQLPRGLAVGIEAESPTAQGAAEDMVRAPGATGAAAGGATISIGDVHIHVASDEPEEMANAFREKLAEILEGLSIEMGGEVPT